LSGSFERRVSGRKRTSIDIPLDCACRENPRRTAMPSSQAPKTRTRVFPMVWFGVMASRKASRRDDHQGLWSRADKLGWGIQTMHEGNGDLEDQPRRGRTPYCHATTSAVRTRSCGSDRDEGRLTRATGHSTPAISTGSWLRGSGSGGLAAELASGRTPVKCRRHTMSMQPRHLAFDITEQGGASLSHIEPILASAR
jgi:hypothetical protein